MTDREVMQQALDALKSAAIFVDSFRGQKATQDAITALHTALEQQAEPVSGCACRWDHEDNRVVTCERHQGWLDVIAEWADRAREAEAKLKAAQPEQQAEPVAVYQWRKQGCADWYDGHHDYSDCGGPYETRMLYTAPTQRQWVGLTDEDLEFWTGELGQGELGRGVIRAVANHLKERNT